MRKKQEIFPTGTIYERIFNYIWKHPIELENKLQLMIPETIIFKNTLPIHWYFSDKNNNIKKRKKENVSVNNIYDVMIKDVHPDQVCCYFMFPECSEKQTDPTKVDKKYSGLTYIDDKSPLKIEYFNSAELKQFLFAEKIPISAGILQKFVQPSTENNCVYQVQYKSKLTQFCKITNNLPFQNHSIDKYERCCTFDGPDYFSTIKSAAKCTASNLKNEVEKILEHLNLVSYGMICFERLDFFFKIDDKEKIYLLFIANTRMKDDKSTSDEQLEKPLFKFREFEPIQTQNPLKPYQIQKLVVCLRCKKREVPDRFQTIPYKFIVDERMVNKKANSCYPTAFNQVEVQNPRDTLNFINENRNNQKTITIDNNILINEQEENRLLQLTISSQGIGDESFLSHQSLQKQKGAVYKNNQVPGIFSVLYPKIETQAYEQIKDEFYFQQQTIKVCLDCYMEVTPYVESSKERSLVNQQQLQFRSNRINEYRSLDHAKYKVILKDNQRILVKYYFNLYIFKQNKITQDYQKQFKDLNDKLKSERNLFNIIVGQNFTGKKNKQKSTDQKIRHLTPEIRDKSLSTHRYREVDHLFTSQNSVNKENDLNYLIKPLFKEDQNFVRKSKDSIKETRSHSTFHISQSRRDQQQPLKISEYIHKRINSLPPEQIEKNIKSARQYYNTEDFSPLKIHNSSNNQKLHQSISTRVSNHSSSRQNTHEFSSQMHSAEDRIFENYKKNIKTISNQNQSRKTDELCEYTKDYKNSDYLSENMIFRKGNKTQNLISLTSQKKLQGKNQLVQCHLTTSAPNSFGFQQNQSELERMRSISTKIKIYKQNSLLKKLKNI